MSTKFISSKPLIVMMYGFPGAGKTSFARQLSEELGIIHLQEDKIAHDLFGEKASTVAGSASLRKITNYMATEFLKNGGSLVYDADVVTSRDRRNIRNMARDAKAAVVLVWLQVDPETTFARTQARDRRTADDKYAKTYTEDIFREVLAIMQNPNNEDYVVVSGKHTFQTQRGTLLKKLYALGVITPESAQNVVKPGLVNLVPQVGLGGRRVDPRRNISIR